MQNSPNSKEYPTDVSDPKNPRIKLVMNGMNAKVFLHMGWEDEFEDPNAPRIKCVGCES